MLLLPIIPSLLGYIHGSSEDNFSEKWENGLLRHSMWPLANFLFLGSKSILMHTRFILVKLCRPTLIQKVWVCGLVVRGADLWGMYVVKITVSHGGPNNDPKTISIMHGIRAI